MYQNYIFDLYGTLADTHTNEGKHYLWNKLSAFFSAYGAIYEPLELKKAYFRCSRQDYFYLILVSDYIYSFLPLCLLQYSLS